MKQDIVPILAKVQESCGVDFTHYREGTLRRRIGRRCMARQCDDLDAYLSVLESDPSECIRLFRDLTIKYTEFFRDPDVFDIINRKVLPTILSNENKSDPVAIWSAGCATGEEAYSLAALVLLSDQWDSRRGGVRIFGTDVDPDAVAIANEGIYTKTYLPKQPAEEALKFFTDDDKSIAALPQLKEIVSFHRHDLLGDNAAEEIRDIWAKGFDLIMCRNVLIYLHRSSQAEVVTLCVEMLRPGGFLVIGTGESLPAFILDRLQVVDDKAKIYQARKG